MNDQSALIRFINHEATAGLILVLAAALALIVTNVGYAEFYDHFLELPVSVHIGGIGLNKTLVHWINDGLMAIFFFLVGLGNQAGGLAGQSLVARADHPARHGSAWRHAGACPDLCFLQLGKSGNLQGWAIPAATDIAFALGALALVGSRVPLSLKVFLLTLATLDDLGAIVIIAIFYTSDLSLVGLGLAGVAFACLVVLNRLRIDRTAPYIFLGFAMWVFVLKSGVHATLAGVALAMTIPLLRTGRIKLHPCAGRRPASLCQVSHPAAVCLCQCGHTAGRTVDGRAHIFRCRLASLRAWWSENH